MQQDSTIPAEAPNTTPPSPVVTPPQEPEQGVVSGEGKPRSGLRSILSTVGILLAAPLIAVALTAFVFQSYEVDGQSMHNTLEDHDRLIIWKVPRTISRITKNPYIPKRGDVVIFVSHELHEQGGNEKQLIKRVIGLPGERVVIADGRYTVYNQEHPEGFDPDVNKEFTKEIVTPTLPEDGGTEFFVGQDEVFVSGDNRVNSLDSRSFGPVKSHDIVGRMVLRIFPVKEAKSYI